MDSTNLLIDSKRLKYFFKRIFSEATSRKKEALKRMQKLNLEMVRKAGEEFLAENKVKEGVKTTDSGLQYIVLKEGKGANVLPTDKIKIHYHGTTIDGKVFDSTVDKKKPYESNANQFIKGFNEGLALMKEGSKYKVFIPQELAYGIQQRGQLIKPFSALIFEIEILDILKNIDEKISIHICCFYFNSWLYISS